MLCPESNTLLRKIWVVWGFFSYQGLQTDAVIPSSTSCFSIIILIQRINNVFVFLLYLLSLLDIRALRSSVNTMHRFRCWTGMSGERAAGPERAASLHGTAGQQGRKNLLSNSVGISGCGCPEGLMGSLMIGPQISIINFHQPPSLGALM